VRDVPNVPLMTVLREWGRIGVIGFGGPPAHIALLRQTVVERKNWIDAREFEDANAACQLLPGPASTQLTIYCARRVAGVAGAWVGGLAFILPGLVLTIAIAAVALQSEPPRWVEGLGAGAAAAVVAVVAQVGIQLAIASLRGRHPRAIVYLVLGAAAAVIAGPGVIVVLLACGAIELSWQRRHQLNAVAWPLALAWTALKAGGLSFGGGFVIIPLMQGDAIAHHWLTKQQFANAVAYGQITPGPVTHTVAMVGWGAGSLPGAALASVIAFAPSFAFVLLGSNGFDRLRGRPGPRAFLDGAGPAAAGAIAGAAILLAAALGPVWQWAVLAAAAAALALKAPPILVLLGGAAAGLLLGP
jgi:chromate transporter